MTYLELLAATSERLHTLFSFNHGAGRCYSGAGTGCGEHGVFRYGYSAGNGTGDGGSGSRRGPGGDGIGKGISRHSGMAEGYGDPEGNGRSNP